MTTWCYYLQTRVPAPGALSDPAWVQIGQAQCSGPLWGLESCMIGHQYDTRKHIIINNQRTKCVNINISTVTDVCKYEVQTLNSYKHSYQHDQRIIAGAHEQTCYLFQPPSVHLQTWQGDALYMQSDLYFPTAILGPGLTHRVRVTHICVGSLTTIGSDNGLSPDRRQAIIWTFFIDILTFAFMEMRLKVSSAKWRPFCLGLNVINIGYTDCGPSTSRQGDIPYQ